MASNLSISLSAFGAQIYWSPYSQQVCVVESQELAYTQTLNWGQLVSLFQSAYLASIIAIYSFSCDGLGPSAFARNPQFCHHVPTALRSFSMAAWKFFVAPTAAAPIISAFAAILMSNTGKVCKYFRLYVLLDSGTATKSGPKEMMWLGLPYISWRMRMEFTLSFPTNAQKDLVPDNKNGITRFFWHVSNTSTRYSTVIKYCWTLKVETVY